MFIIQLYNYYYACLAIISLFGFSFPWNYPLWILKNSCTSQRPCPTLYPDAVTMGFLITSFFQPLRCTAQVTSFLIGWKITHLLRNVNSYEKHSLQWISVYMKHCTTWTSCHTGRRLTHLGLMRHVSERKNKVAKYDVHFRVIMANAIFS